MRIHSKILFQIFPSNWFFTTTLATHDHDQMGTMVTDPNGQKLMVINQDQDLSLSDFVGKNFTAITEVKELNIVAPQSQ